MTGCTSGGYDQLWPSYAFKNVDYDALHFHTGSLKINILGGREAGREGNREGGRGHKKVLCIRF